jgi:molybdopterin/thiamine biosynthesis adenylyltransferase
MNIVIIGLGGIGSILCERLARFLTYSAEPGVSLLLVDGDSYESKNFERQDFTRMGNKAEVKAADLKMQFSKLNVSSFPAFVNDTNLAQVIKEGNIVFLCVDNHKTRMIVSNYCKALTDITLISGGNDLIDGNVQIYIRKSGRDLTPDLCSYHPEIANPDDKSPEEMSCEELSVSEPQLYFANLGVATIMCWAFYNAVVKEQYEKSEVYFDITQMASSAKTRIVKTK